MTSINSAKTALVTGGTDGIGKEIARGLARSGCEVVVVGRNRIKPERAVSDLRSTVGSQSISFVQADLSLMSEADRVADNIKKKWSTLHYLVHSAGVVRGRRIVTRERMESNFAINYLSRFVLTRRLLPLLQAAGKPGHASRILIVGGVVPNGTIHWKDVNLTKNFTTIRALKQFQFANDVFAVEFARRLSSDHDRPAVSIMCFNPGVVTTNIREEFPLWMKWLVRLAFDPLLGQTAIEAADSALALLLSDEFEGETGAPFRRIRKFRRVPPGKQALNPEVGLRFWELSERLSMHARWNSSRELASTPTPDFGPELTRR